MMKIPENITTIRNDTVEIERVVYPVLGVNVIPGEFSDTSLLKFDWSVQSYQGNQLVLQLYFDHPEVISLLT
jgi:hypothetical protein